MPVSLVFGASGAIGRFLVPRLLAANHDVIALSRAPRTARHPRLRWITGDLYGEPPAVPEHIDAIYSVGPLDGCVRWLEQTGPDASARIVAIGSLSAQTKQTSDDAHERELAERLLESERKLAALADARGSAWTVLRATLIYGAGLDRSLTPIVDFARRWRVFPYVARAPGLRQPVHADDLAWASLAVTDNRRTMQQVYGVGGGERLAFAAMLERVRASLPFRTIALPISPLAVRIGAGLAPRFRAATRAAMLRLGQDLIVDDSRAAHDFGWSPRRFAPDAQTWMPPPLA